MDDNDIQKEIKNKLSEWLSGGLGRLGHYS
jgi:hypothetical protein